MKTTTEKMIKIIIINADVLEVGVGAGVVVVAIIK